MGNIFDDELDEYAEQQVNTPTVPASVPTAAPQQQKSAELAEIEQSLEVLKGIKEVQGEMRKTMSELTDMTEKAQSISKQLSDDIREAKPIWDDLLKSFVGTIEVSDESMEKFNEVMLTYANKIVSRSCDLINKAVTENVAGQFNEVANQHIADFDEKMKKAAESHKTALSNLKKEYEDKINSLENKQGKLLKQAIEEKNRVLMPTSSFWTIICIFGIIILLGFASWFKFWKTPGNDETMTYMVAALFAELIYICTMVYNHYAYKEDQNKETDKKKAENEPKIYSISLSEAVYIIFLTLASLVYFVWAQLDISSSSRLLIYLLPVALASNFLWLVIRGLLYGIFQKD